MCVYVCVSNSNWNCIPRQKRGIPWGIAAKNPSMFFGFMGMSGGYQLGYQLINPGFIAKSPVYLFIMLLRMLPGSN